MVSKTIPLTRRTEWAELLDHFQSVVKIHPRKLFAEDSSRGKRFVIEAAGLYLDYSKNPITEETVRLLIKLAESAGLRASIDAMFAGEKINVTEERPVLHLALRAPAYRDSVLPPNVTARVSVEQASTFGWSKYVGLGGHAIGMSSFGASAPLKDLRKIRFHRG